MNPILTAVCVIGAIGLLGRRPAGHRLQGVRRDQGRAGGGSRIGAARGQLRCLPYAAVRITQGGGRGCAGEPVASAGGAAVAEKIAAIMGVEAGAATEYKAMIACQGDTAHTKKRYEYHGIPSCAACNVLYNGDSSCPFGCLGFGDCARACKFGAIQVVDGVARVDEQKCTGCGACESVCPKRIIFLYAYRERPKPIVMCSNHKKGVDTRRDCTAGCLGCGKCVRNCPVQAIYIRDNVARVDYTKCVGCGKCAKGLPGGQHPHSEALAGKGRVTQQI